MLIKFSSDPLERLHISVLKWTLGLPKRTSNASVWGDTGRHPLALKLSKLTIDYLNKLILLDNEDSEKLVRHAFVEQKNLDLSWFSSIQRMTLLLDPTSDIKGRTTKPPNSVLCCKRGQDIFEEHWTTACQQNKKLAFYSTVKSKFQLEPYIGECKHLECKLVGRWRMSAHKLNRETGRYGSKAGSIHHKCCGTCTNLDVIELLTELPGEWNPILEDEVHVMVSCPRYNNIRSKLKDTTKDLLETDVASLFSAEQIKECSIFIKKLLNERFKKK